MKRLLSLLLCVVLALFCATTAQAAGVSITLTASNTRCIMPLMRARKTRSSSSNTQRLPKKAG